MPPEAATDILNPTNPSGAIETRSLTSSVLNAQNREHDINPNPDQDVPSEQWVNIRHMSTLSSSGEPVGNDNAPLRIATLSPPVGQFIINTILQMAGFAAAIAFGVFAVRSVNVGHDANRFAAQALDEAVIANKLAMLALCLASVNQVGTVPLKSHHIVAKSVPKRVICETIDRTDPKHMLKHHRRRGDCAAKRSLECQHPSPELHYSGEHAHFFYFYTPISIKRQCNNDQIADLRNQHRIVELGTASELGTANITSPRWKW